MITDIDPSKLITQYPFNTLFPVESNILAAIKENMEEKGFDRSKPIDIWNGIVIDGHTRLNAARELGIEIITSIPVYEHEFVDETEAIEYAIHNQRDRRNLTDADILRCVEALDGRKKAGRPEKLASSEANFPDGKSARKTAGIIGTSRPKVERARKVLDHAPEEIKQAVFSGKKSINRAYNETREAQKNEVLPKPMDPAVAFSKSTFNRTNDNIKWAAWTWNPVTGCKHGCTYCYARDIYNRFGEGDFSEPRLHPARLAAPRNTKFPGKDAPINQRNVFVGSMCDLFGEWMPQEWIDQIMEIIREYPLWNFLFLTKNPQRLSDISWPQNAWVGVTVDCQERVTPAEAAMKQVRASVKFVSCEPLREHVVFSDISIFDLIIVGAQSKTTALPEMQPEWLWLASLISQSYQSRKPLFIKENVKTAFPQELPGR